MGQVVSSTQCCLYYSKKLSLSQLTVTASCESDDTYAHLDTAGVTASCDTRPLLHCLDLLCTRLDSLAPAHTYSVTMETVAFHTIFDRLVYDASQLSDPLQPLHPISPDVMSILLGRLSNASTFQTLVALEDHDGTYNVNDGKEDSRTREAEASSQGHDKTEDLERLSLYYYTIPGDRRGLPQALGMRATHYNYLPGVDSIGQSGLTCAVSDSAAAPSTQAFMIAVRRSSISMSPYWSLHYFADGSPSPPPPPPSTYAAAGVSRWLHDIFTACPAPDLIPLRFGKNIRPEDTGVYAISLATSLSFSPCLIQHTVNDLLQQQGTASMEDITEHFPRRWPTSCSIDLQFTRARCANELLTTPRCIYLLGTMTSSTSSTITMAMSRADSRAKAKKQIQHRVFSVNMQNLHARHRRLLRMAIAGERTLPREVVAQLYREAVALLCVFRWAAAAKLCFVSSWT